MSTARQGFLILDFGSQVTMLIARRLRELGYYSEVKAFNEPIENIRKFNPDGIILSGGPNSVYDEKSPKRDVNELLNIAPVLGICYGMQLLAHQLEGKVEKGSTREYGLTEICWDEGAHRELKMSWPMKHKIWMSHGDVVTKIPAGARELLRSAKHIAGFVSEKFMGLQYHPEVSHSEYGTEFLRFFADWCNAKPTWKHEQVLAAAEKYVTTKVGQGEHVLCALSGGVDSSVVATLLTKVLGAERVHCAAFLRRMKYLRAFPGLRTRNRYLRGSTFIKGWGTPLTRMWSPVLPWKSNLYGAWLLASNCRSLTTSVRSKLPFGRV